MLPEVQFLMYCDVPEDFKQYMETHRRPFGLDNVLFMGRYDRHDIPYLVAKMDMAVVPSRRESWGLVARELRMQGIPCIATKTGGLDGDVKPGDAKALADAIRREI
jgi:glycosyltransferase involved in cell wall biosynthesis